MSLQNRSQTFNEKITQFAAAGATVALTPLLINGRVVIPLNTAGATVLNSFLIEGEISDYPQAAVAIAFGDAIYWDDGAKVFTNVATSNTLCGHALEASLASTGAGIIAFNSFESASGAFTANLNTWAVTLATKLNNDAGVTDNNYDIDPQT